MKRIEIDRDSWDRGYADGRDGKLVPPGSGSFSYWAGFIEGKADRGVSEDLEKERRPKGGGCLVYYPIIIS